MPTATECLSVLDVLAREGAVFDQLYELGKVIASMLDEGHEPRWALYPLGTITFAYMAFGPAAHQRSAARLN